MLPAREGSDTHGVPRHHHRGAEQDAVEKIDIFPLDVKQLPREGMIAIVGRTESGKSTIARSILYHLRKKFDLVLVMCGSQQDADKWERHVPGLFVHTTFDSKALFSILETCEKNQALGHPCSAIIIVDDALYRTDTKNAAIMQDLACRGRQAHILTVAMMHDAKDVSIKNRGQLALVLLCFEANRMMRERMYEVFNPCFEHFEQFDRAFKACTANFGALGLWLKNRHSYDAAAYAFSYRAKWPEKQYLFNKRSEQWRVHQMHFDPNFRMRKYAPKAQAANKARAAAAATMTLPSGRARAAGPAPYMPPPKPYRTADGTLVDGPFPLNRRANNNRRVMIRVHERPRHARLRTT